MSTASREPVTVARPAWMDVRDMWASLAIVAIWLAVAISAAFGPDIRTVSVDGSSASIPTGIVVGLFAMFATMSVAKHGFDRRGR